MEQTNLQPEEIIVNNDQNKNKVASTDNNLITYKPLLQPIYDKKLQKHFTFIDYNHRACICIHLIDKENNLVKNNLENPKLLYKFVDKILLNNKLIVNETPFADKNLVFTYIDTFKTPRFRDQRPNSRGYYGDWVLVRDDHWMNK